MTRGPAVTAGYIELHSKSFYSFGVGASHAHEMLSKAVELGYPALALTDTNLCGALEFARLAGSLGVQPVTGGELTLLDGSRLVMLAKTREGYANISRLFTLANSEDRRKPRLDPALMREYAGGVVLLTGGRGGPLARLLSGGRREDARALLVDYLEWYGSGSVYVELQQNFLQGDTERNRESARLAAGGRRSRCGDQRRPLPLARRGTGCSTPWSPPASTPPSTRPCPSSAPTTTCI